MSAISKTDLLLAKAKRISDSNNTSVTTYLRRKIGLLCRSKRKPEKRVRKLETTLWTPRSLKKEVEEVLQVLEQRLLSSLNEDHSEKGCAPAAHEGPQWSRDPPAARAEPCTRASGCLKETVHLGETHAAVGFWQDLWNHGERSSHQSSFLAGLVIPQKTHTGVAHEQLQPM